MLDCSFRTPKKPTLKALPIVGILRVANIILRVVARVFFGVLPWRKNWQPKRILVHRYGNVGDVVVAVPALAALRLRFPNAYIVLLTSPGSEKWNLPGAKEILAHSDVVDEIWCYYLEDIHESKRRRRLIERIRRGRFDLLVALNNERQPLRKQVREMVFFRLCGIRRAIGWEVVHPPDCFRRWARKMEFLPQTLRLLRLIRRLRVDERTAIKSAARFLRGSDADASWAETVVAQLRVRGRKVIGLHPGGKTAVQKWPLERWEELARRVKKTGFRILVLGGDTDREWCERIRPYCDGEMFIKLPFGRLIELTRRLDVLVSHDTGLAHIAAALGTPLVAIYSGRNYRYKWDPFGCGRIRVIRADNIDCEGCFLSDCPTHRCMREIDVDRVVTAVGELCACVE